METTPNPQPKPVRITRDQIKETDAFQQASKIIQHLTLKRNCYRAIEHGVNVALNIGFDRWDGQTHASFVNREIIRELVQTINNK